MVDADGEARRVTAVDTDTEFDVDHEADDETLVDRVGARIRPRWALVVAVLAISTSAILIRWSGAPSAVEAFYRVGFTIALLAPVALLRHRGEFRALRRRDALAAALTGVALALHFASWFQSVEWTSIAASVTLVQSQPLFVAVGAWVVLDERLGRRTVAGILVAVGGMILMSVGEFLTGATGPRPLWGNALAVAGALAAAVYILAGRSLRQRVALVPYVIVVYSVCAVVLLAIVLGQGAPLRGYPASDWVLFLAMAVGPGVFGHTVINWALEHVESSVVSVSLLGEPVASTLLATVLIPEIPGAWTVVGGVVVLTGIYVTARAQAAIRTRAAE